MSVHNRKLWPTISPCIDHFPPLAPLAGFPIDQLTQEEVVLAYGGLGMYWGNLRSQNAKGHVVRQHISFSFFACTSTSIHLTPVLIPGGTRQGSGPQPR